jgi:TPP-dependent pyruvate/acetoin dehydrogenase alpha subunit
VLFCCENNRYAMGTALERSHSVTDLALKAAAYGMAAWPVDGMDVGAVEAAGAAAVEAIRNGGGPVFLELQTYRFRAHSMYDPERYRSKDEVAAWRQRDPLTVLPADLIGRGLWSDEQQADLDAEVTAAVDRAVAEAEAGTFEPVEELTRFVYSEDAP